MPATIPSPNINISSPSHNGFLAPTSPASSFGSFRRTTSSFHSFHKARSSFLGASPFPYAQDPHFSDNVFDAYSSSPSRGDIYERDLEANYCKNFSCCGLTLGDLHALLQHYEEAHVHFEEDQDDDLLIAGGFTDDDGWSTHSESIPSSPQMSSASSEATAAAIAALTKNNPVLSFVESKKKPTTGVSLSDIYSQDPAFIPDDAVAAFPDSIFKATQTAGKKRDLSTFSSSFDVHSPVSKRASMHTNKLISTHPTTAAALTAVTLMGDLQSSVKSSATATVTATATTATAAPASLSAAAVAASQEEVMTTVTGYLEQAIQRGLLPNCHEVGSPAYLQAVEELLRKRDEIISMMESIGRPGSAGADKPYRCSVNGCDKAYKNPNGLKYHNQHGHCSMPGANEDDKNNIKPYRCTFLDCGKCYKNLNGLKYHIEHSHPNLAAALYANLPGFINLEGSNASQAAITAAAAIAAVKGDSVMMSAINAIIASAINNGNRPSSTTPSATHTTEPTPESSPNSSPLLRPVGLAAARGTLPNASLSVQTTIGGNKDAPVKLAGLMTPLTLSPTLSATLKSPTNGSQVSTLTAALAAVAVEQQRAMQK
ncbi:MAG: hypothetical protein J3Q66DRAFT_388265 [Benniella sp.]|nr:MAG: hypothetical protein J3Q66DRAFT_388265 [Benniella sp.]